jgi:hypothetical protein
MGERQRRVILLRRQLKRPLAIVDHGDPAQPRLGFAEVWPSLLLCCALPRSVSQILPTLGHMAEAGVGVSTAAGFMQMRRHRNGFQSSARFRRSTSSRIWRKIPATDRATN